MLPTRRVPSRSTGVEVRFGEAFYDVPSQRPAVPVALPTVSVRNQRILLHVRDQLVGGTLPLVCEVDVRVSLRAEQRGIHMSRIQTALQTTSEQSLSDFALAFARRVAETQQQDVAEVRLRADAPLLTRTRVTDLTSPDTIQISATATAGTASEISQSVAATNITACPCMQGYALTDLINEVGLTTEDGIDLLGRVPIATHSQRGRVRLTVEAREPDRLPGYLHLYRVLAAHTALTQELLKRPDEYDLVRRAHLAPQFVEDVARAVAGGVIRSLSPHDGLGDIVVDVVAESYESIHGHDILARLRGPAADLARQLDG